MDGRCMVLVWQSLGEPTMKIVVRCWQFWVWSFPAPVSIRETRARCIDLAMLLSALIMHIAILAPVVEALLGCSIPDYAWPA